MKILLLYSNLEAPAGFPAALGVLSSYLKSKGHEVGGIYLHEKWGLPLDFKLIDEAVRSFNAAFMGFSVSYNQIDTLNSISRHLKEKFPEMLIVYGGIYPTTDPDAVMKEKSVDIVCVGEGELPFEDLANALENKVDYTTIKNLVVRKNGQIIKNPVRPLINDLSILPPTDYDLFGNIKHVLDESKGWIHVMAGRGCLMKCTYCYNHQLQNLYSDVQKSSNLPLQMQRFRPVNDFVQELKSLKDNYDVQVFNIFDDIFTSNISWLKEFAVAYPRDVGLPYSCWSHVNFMDPERAQYLKQSNCIRCIIGIESGNDKIRRDLLLRYMTNEQIITAMQAVKQAGVELWTTNMMGLPGESVEDIRSTIRLNAQGLGDGMKLFTFFPFPQTQLRKVAEERNLIDFEKEKNFNNFSDDTILKLDADVMLFIKKVRAYLPWYLNAYSNLPCKDIYLPVAS